MLAGGLALAAAAAGLTGCDLGSGSPAAPLVRLGALFGMSGPVGEVGQRSAAAARLAVTEANAAGGVLGRQIELIVGDDGCDANTAVLAANSMVTRDIVASVGGACSVGTVPTVKIFHDAGIPMIIPSSNSTDLVDPGFDTVFLMSGTTAAEATYAVGQIRRRGGEKIAVIDDGTSYSMTLAKATTAAASAPDSGLTIVGRQTITPGEPSYRRVADDTVHQGADALYFTGYYAEAARLVVDLEAAGYRGKIFLGDGAVDDSLATKLSAAQAAEVYFTAFPIPSLIPDTADWADRYAEANGSRPGPNTMEAYDAVQLALDAIRRAGSTDRAAVRAAIAATDELTLLTGPVRFNSDGTRSDPRFLLLRIRDGKLVAAPQ